MSWPCSLLAVKTPKGVKPVLSDHEIIEKFNTLLNGLLDDQCRQTILNCVMTIEDLSDPHILIGELKQSVKSFM